MEASELRINNYVEYNEEIDDVFSLGGWSTEINLNNQNVTDVRDIKPIPLTEEWLLKLGFEENKENNWFSISGGSEAIPVLVRIWAKDRIQVYYHWNYKQMNHIGYVNHVHQLQNLYYALTGSELTIKETV